MLSFKSFRKEIGFKCGELEKITGYSRQGLDFSFKNMDNGKVSKKFLVCLEVAIKIKIESETRQFESRMESLKELQDKLQQR